MIRQCGIPSLQRTSDWNVACGLNRGLPILAHILSSARQLENKHPKSAAKRLSECLADDGPAIVVGQQRYTASGSTEV